MQLHFQFFVPFPLSYDDDRYGELAVFKATVLAKVTKRNKVFYSLDFVGDTPTDYPVEEIYICWS
jgi:hypothetical protein